MDGRKEQQQEFDKVFEWTRNFCIIMNTAGEEVVVQIYSVCSLLITYLSTTEDDGGEWVPKGSSAKNTCWHRMRVNSLPKKVYQ